jgi:hypothetical protein
MGSHQRFLKLGFAAISAVFVAVGCYGTDDSGDVDTAQGGTGGTLHGSSGCGPVVPDPENPMPCSRPPQGPGGTSGGAGEGGASCTPLRTDVLCAPPERGAPTHVPVYAADDPWTAAASGGQSGGGAGGSTDRGGVGGSTDTGGAGGAVTAGGVGGAVDAGGAGGAVDAGGAGGAAHAGGAAGSAGAGAVTVGSCEPLDVQHFDAVECQGFFCSYGLHVAEGDCCYTIEHLPEACSEI